MVGQKTTSERRRQSCEKTREFTLKSEKLDVRSISFTVCQLFDKDQSIVVKISLWRESCRPNKQN